MRAAAVTRAYRQEVPLFFKLTQREFSEKDAYAAIARMTSDKWWLNSLRRHNNAWREHLQIALTNVSKHKSLYASKVAVSEWREQKRRTREFLKSMELKDEEGNRVSLIDKFYGSSANPAIRRTEMMVRIRGFENICNELGYVAEFYTLTAPSKYHATTRTGTVTVNGTAAARLTRKNTSAKYGAKSAQNFTGMIYGSLVFALQNLTMTELHTGTCFSLCAQRKLMLYRK